MRIDLPDSLKSWLEQQAQFDGQPSVDAYVASLLFRLKDRKQRKIEQALLEALASGDPIEVTPEFWENQRRQLEEYAKGLGKAAG